MTERNQDLDRDVDRHEACDQDSFPTRRWCAGFYHGRCNASPKNGNDPARPARRKKKSSRCNCEPGKDVERKDLRVQKMKDYRDTEGDHARATPEKKRHHQQIYEKRGVARGVGRPFLMQCPGEQRRGNLLLEPGSDWLAVQAVRRNFRK